MLSYNNDREFKRRFLAQVRAHRRADSVIQGTYGRVIGKKWKGCAIACAARSLDKIDGKDVSKGISFGRHSDVAERLGIPLTLAHLEEEIFEGLSKGLSLEWPARFAKAIPVGRDVSLVWARFAFWLLTDEKHGVRRFAKTDRAREAIDGVVALYTRELSGDKPSLEEWRAARSAAAAYVSPAAAYVSPAATYAAAAAYVSPAATYAAYAAAAAAASASAASAARRRWYRAAADKLVELLESA